MASTSRLADPAARPLYAPPTSLQGQGPTTRTPFNPEDPHVYFDQQAQAWRCEAYDDDLAQDDTAELEWDAQQEAWMPVLDDQLISKQQQAYGADGQENSLDGRASGSHAQRKRKQPRERGVGAEGDRSAKQPKKKLNTNVFVTGLPLDATRDEIASVFSRYGVLYEDDAGEPRVKMYADRKTGMFKGEALVTFFKEESVDLAIRVLDESALRAAEGKSDPIMHVSRAEFSSERKRLGDERAEGDVKIDQARHNQSVSEAQGQQPVKPSATDRKKAQKRFARMNDKLTDWNSDSDSDGAQTSSVRVSSAAAASLAKARQVCLRKMFSLAELDEDPTLLLDLKEDVREECETLGKVTNVVLWDCEPEGLITIKFGTHDAAVACVHKMNGRFFGGRQIVAHLLEGKPRFRRSGKGDEGQEDSDEEDHNDGGRNGTSRVSNKEESKRRDAFGEWLEGGGE